MSTFNKPTIGLPDHTLEYRHRSSFAGITNYILAGMTTSVSMTTTAPSADILRAIPFIIPSGGLLTELAVCVTTGSAGSGEIGIYSNIEIDNLYPSGLLVDSLPFDTAVSGVKTTNVSYYLEAGKIYWAVYHNTGTATIRALAFAGLCPIYGTDINFGPVYRTFLMATQTFGIALPSVFPAGAEGASNAAPPAIRLLVS